MVTGRPALHLSPLDSSRNASLLVLAYSPSNGIITIFRLMLSLDYIEDYIIQIKIRQAFFKWGFATKHQTSRTTWFRESNPSAPHRLLPFTQNYFRAVDRNRRHLSMKSITTRFSSTSMVSLTSQSCSSLFGLQFQ